MIFLPYFHEHDDFIEGNEEFKFGGMGGGEDSKNSTIFFKKIKILYS